MKKRWMSAALCAVMVAGSLAGCGLKTPDAPTTVSYTHLDVYKRQGWLTYMEETRTWRQWNS